jgi:4-alpha-glucanotransferase
MERISRENGILFHISALPGKYGIGTMGKEAYRFVDFLTSCKVNIWQLLPLNLTSYGDSPY